MEEDLGDDTMMDDDESSSSEEEEDNKQTARPYNELLQLLHANADSKGPARKRRKVEKDETAEEVPDEMDEEEDLEEDLEGSEQEDTLEDQAPSDDEQEEEEADDDDTPGPFERHFDIGHGTELTQQIKQIDANKWSSSKKEVDGLRLVRAVPESGDKATLLSALKTTANLKVLEIPNQSHIDEKYDN